MHWIGLIFKFQHLLEIEHYFRHGHHHSKAGEFLANLLLPEVEAEVVEAALPVRPLKEFKI